MCGVFGFIGQAVLPKEDIRVLLHHSEQRGSDSSGLMLLRGGDYQVLRADFAIDKLARRADLGSAEVFFGHSRLITNGFADNQPVVRGDVHVVHNGIVVNHDALWQDLPLERTQEIDTEIIAALVQHALDKGRSPEEAAHEVLERCKGVVACVVGLPALGKVVLFSNNGSLYLGSVEAGQVFASEQFPLAQIGAQDIVQVREPVVIDVPAATREVEHREWRRRRNDLVPQLGTSSVEEARLVHPEPDLLRCTRCILPSTMPSIAFDDEGVCNYCLHYKVRNNPRPKEELFDLVEPYRREEGNECIVPFSGGRDSLLRAAPDRQRARDAPGHLHLRLGHGHRPRAPQHQPDVRRARRREHHRGRRHHARSATTSARTCEAWLKLAAPRDDQHPDRRRQALLHARRDHEGADRHRA